MNPEQVTLVVMRIVLPAVRFSAPGSPQLLTDYGIAGGAESAWHCHILEHEAHDVLRPLVVE